MKKYLPIEFKSFKENQNAFFALLKRSSTILGLYLLISAQSFGQTTVFNETFTGTANTLVTAASPAMTYTSNLGLTTASTGAAYVNTSGQLTIENGNPTGAAGYGYVRGASSSFNSPYSTTLESNLGAITWSCNMRTNRSSKLHSSGLLASASYVGAVVLACDNANPLTAGSKGYALIETGGTTYNKFAVVYFSDGINSGTSTSVTTICSTADAGTGFQNYFSLKVTFDPTTKNWTLSFRDDGTTAFADPLSTATSYDATVSSGTNSTATNVSMPNFAFAWKFSTTANNNIYFDNLKIVLSVNSAAINAPSVSSLTNFVATGSTSSAEQTFTISGQYLTNSIVITAPTNYEVSTTSGSGFGATATLANTATQSATIYVRLKSGLTDGAKTGNITIASSGAASTSNYTVALSGNVSSTPTLTPSVSSLTQFANTAAGANSASSNFSLSGVNLSSGNVIVSAPANFVVSTDNSTFSSSVTITPSSGNVSSTIYVRYSPTGSGGYSGNVTIAYTGITTQNVAVSGYLSTFYYKTGSTSLATLANWSGTANGTGTSLPNDFTTVGITYKILSNTTTTDVSWNVAGTGSIISVGDPSVAGVTLTIASGFDITITAVSPVVGNGVIDIPAALSGANSVVLQNPGSPPSFGTMHATSEVHYQAAISTSTSKTFGKMFIENNSSVTFSGTPIIQTSLLVASGATLSTGSVSTNYYTINSGASVTINGTFQTQKSVGFVSSSVTTPSSSSGTIQFVGTENLTLGAASTIVYNRASSGTTQTMDARSDYKNLTISGLDNSKTFATGTLGISGALTVATTVTASTGTSNLTFLSPLTLIQNSTIALSPVAGTAQTLTFADNSTTAWTAGKKLNVTGWQGTQGASGTAGKIFFGTTSAGLTAQQLSQIVFTISSVNYTAAILSTGEIVPTFTVLPVRLLSFTGKKENNVIQLNWSTASETNNQRFDILRAGADKSFQKIGEINGNGNSNATLYYNFSDRKPLAGMNYYKLSQVDFDGKTQEFGPIAITSDLNVASLEVYAAPDHSQIIVFINSNETKEAFLNIFDVSGRSLIKQNISLQEGANKFNIPANGLNKGMHLIEISSKEGRVIRKFMN